MIWAFHEILRDQRRKDLHRAERRRGNDNILYAAGSGNLPAVRHILRQKPAAVHVTSAGDTPLDFARQCGRAELVEILEAAVSRLHESQGVTAEAEAARRAAAQAAANATAKAVHCMSAATAQITSLLLVKSSPIILQAEEEAEAAARHEAEADTKFARKCWALRSESTANLFTPCAKDFTCSHIFLQQQNWGDGRCWTLPPRLAGGDNIFTAAINGNLPAVRHLLRQRPAAVHETSLGKAPLDYARENRHNEVAQILKAAVSRLQRSGPSQLPRWGGRWVAVVKALRRFPRAPLATSKSRTA
eukprot:Skav210117  [mRNA]  locus=scaffold2194:97997:101519:+ [translate_table: standard]